MEYADYFTDTLPKRYTVLGVPLLPLSAGHLIRLNQVENTFLLGGDLTLEDLALGVLICSRNWDDCTTILNSPKLVQYMRRWQRRVCGQTGLLYWLGLRSPAKVGFAEAFILFSEYLKAGMKMPNVRYDASQSKETGCPLVLWVLNKVESKTAWARAQLLDRPWVETLFDWLTLEAQDGNIDGFMDKASMEEIEEGTRFAKEVAKEMGII